MAEIADAVAEVTPEAPVVEAPVVEAPPVETPEAPAAEAPDYGWIEEAGGAQAVREAYEFRESLRTEEGVVDAFVEFGVTLGLAPEQLVAMFPGVEEDIKEAEAEAEKPLTRAEVEELIQSAVLQPMEARDVEQKTAVVRETLLSDLDTRGIGEGERDVFLQFADRHLDPAERLDPKAVRAAVEAGAKDYEAWIETQIAARIKGKIETKATIPTPLSGGGTPGGEAADEPMSLAEAKARVRQQR